MAHNGVRWTIEIMSAGCLLDELGESLDGKHVSPAYRQPWHPALLPQPLNAATMCGREAH